MSAWIAWKQRSGVVKTDTDELRTQMSEALARIEDLIREAPRAI
jgi:hypothetical protein